MVIKTKSIFEPAEEDDGLRILITRYYPRGVKQEHIDYWVRELSPSPDLLFRYKEGRCNWIDFKRRFLVEMWNNLASLEVVYSLNHCSNTTDITLLCYERNGQPCHRHLVRDIIESPDLLKPF